MGECVHLDYFRGSLFEPGEFVCDLGYEDCMDCPYCYTREDYEYDRADFLYDINNDF